MFTLQNTKVSANGKFQCTLLDFNIRSNNFHDCIVTLTNSIKMTLKNLNNNIVVGFTYETSDDKKEVKIEVFDPNQQFQINYGFHPIHKDYRSLNFSHSGYWHHVKSMKVTLKEPLTAKNNVGIIKDLSSLVNNPKLSDFKFKVDGADFHIHKAILAARSPIFSTMFTGEFRESKSNQTLISDVSQEAFLEFLNFLYTDSVKDINSHVIELLVLSDLYDVKDLKLTCEAQMNAGLSEDNAPDIFQYAHRYRCDQNLKEAAFKLIQKSFAKNNFKLPEEFVNSPDAVKKAVDTRNQMEALLKVDEGKSAVPLPITISAAAQIALAKLNKAKTRPFNTAFSEYLN